MKTAQLVEIFSSIQGEGKYVGVKQVFVRFYKCNMHCVWCDTPHSIGDKNQSFKTMDLAELNAEIDRLWANTHSLSLTGGEPLLQAEFIKELIANKSRSYHLETNGTLPGQLEQVIDGIDVVAMDLKMPSSTKDRTFWKEHEEFLKVAIRKDAFIKIVVTHDTEDHDFEQAVELVSKIKPELMFIVQPNSFELNRELVLKCQRYRDYALKFLPEARLLPQMHKFLKIA